MKRIFSIRHQPLDIDLVLLLVRIACGYAFILIGWGKIQNPTGWMGPDPKYPGFLIALAAISEFVGGMALILGLVTRLAAFGICCTMLVAVKEHIFTMGDPFVNLTGGGAYQLPVMYFFIALLLLVNGPGRFSIDRFLFGQQLKT